MKQHFVQGKIQRAIITFCLLIFSSIFIFSNLFYPTKMYAQGAPVIDAAKISQDTAKTIWEKIGKVLGNVAAASTRNVINATLGKLAYDSATWLASAGTGQQSLVFSKSPGEYMKDMGDAAGGAFIDGVASGVGIDAAQICAADPSLNIKFGLSLETLGPSSPYEPTCTFSEFQGNVEEMLQDPSFDKYVNAQFDPAANSLGQIMVLSDKMKEVAETAGEMARLERTAGVDYVPVKGKVDETIQSPPSAISTQVGTQFSSAWENSFKVYGNPLADSLSIFTNTLISKFTQRIQAGLVNLFTGAELGDLIAGSTGGTTAGVEAAAAVYASLNQPNFVTVGTYDVFPELSACPEKGATSINCVMGSTMQAATQNKWTVNEFVDYLDEVQGNSEFKFATDDIDSPESGVSYRAILVLKKFRIVPVGWQLAADFIRSESTTGNPTLKQIMDCYNACGGSTEDAPDCSEDLMLHKDTNGDGIEENTYYTPFCGLIDPNWVLKAPENYCARQAPGPDIVYQTWNDDDGLDDTLQMRTLSRSDYCADNRGCIQEEQENICTAYGACSKEDRIYRGDGQVCDEAYATCQKFEVMDGDNAGDTVNYIKNTLNYDDCASDPGCKWYCLFTDNADNFICKDVNTVYNVCDSEDGSGVYYTNESCSCSVSETCWVNAGSGGSEPDTYKACSLGYCGDSSAVEIDTNGDDIGDYNDYDSCIAAGHSWYGSGSYCDLGDNCGSSNAKYNPEREQCLCSAANTCDVETDTDTDTNGDGIVDESDYITTNTCDYDYDDGKSIGCILDDQCNPDYETYTSAGYCHASSVGDSCTVKLGESDCVNDLGNTCTLTSACTSDYCDCTISDSVGCDIAEGAYSCTDETGYNIALGTTEESSLTPSNTDIYANASINFDNNLQECESTDASCTKLYRILESTNLLYNSNFVIVSGTIDDTSVDLFGAYANNGEACNADDSTGEGGKCIGWQPSTGYEPYAISDTNDYNSAITLPADSTGAAYIANTVDTGYALANRTFTFAIQAKAVDTASPVKFTIGSADSSITFTIPDNLTDDMKADYAYFTDTDGDGAYDGLDYSTDYTNYYYTYTFPDSITDSNITVKIFAATTDIAVSIAQLGETDSWTDSFTAYGGANEVYMKTADQSCETEDIGCELYTPKDQEDAAAIPAQITNPNSSVCGNGENFSDPGCNQCTGLNDQEEDYYNGCDFYQEIALSNNTPLNNYQSYLAGNDTALAGVAQRTGWYCTGTQLSCFPNDDDSTCSDFGLACENNISLIPDTAKQCSAAEIGCEEYTNLDTVAAGGEGLEYYTYIRPCVKTTDDADKIYTYHTWEGSDSEGYAMVLYNLKKSNVDSGPCTHLDLSSEEPNALCADDDYGIEDCSAQYGIDPNCVKYYDDDLNVYYRYQSQTISVSDECLPLRSTIDQRVYYSITSESVTCNSISVGCREYQGSDAGSVEQIINEDFADNSTENWPGAYSTSNESLFTDDYSLRLDSGTTDEGADATSDSNIYYNLYDTVTSDNGEVTYQSDIQENTTYIINFWAKGSGTLEAYLSGACDDNTAADQASCGGDWLGLASNYYFTESGYTTDSASSDINISISGDGWSYYVLGPIYLPSSENIDAATLRLKFNSSDSNTAGYVDNVILEKSNSQYLIKGSFNICPDYEGCRAYQDRNSNTHYLKSFQRMCEESNVGCEAIINTANSQSEFTETYLTTNEYDNDDVTVPYDQIVPLIYSTDQSCSSTAMGCTALGLPDINEQTGVVSSFAAKYGLVKPDDYINLLCEDPQLACRTYYSEFDGTVYFKDPGERVCEYQSYTNTEGVTTYGWFKQDSDASSPDCPKIYEYADPSQPLGPICNSNSQEKAGKNCNNNADCYPEDWVDGNPVPRCISSAYEDIDQWDCTSSDPTACEENHYTDDGYSIDRNQDFGWAGLCDEANSGCSEYVDPNSPNIEEEITNNSFEDNVKNNIEEVYFDSGESVELDTLPDYWQAEPSDGLYESGYGWTDSSDTTGGSENYTLETEKYYDGTNSLKLTGDYKLINSSPISISRDKLYTFEIYVKIPEEAKYTDGTDYYKKISLGAIFTYVDSSDSLMTLADDAVSDEQKYFVAQDLTITDGDYVEDENDEDFSQWLRLSGNIGLGSTVEIPEGAEFASLILEVSHSGTASSDNSIWFDAASFKENDKYYLLDYTVDGTTERESTDNVHTCIDQDTEEEAVTSDGGCVAFRDPSIDSLQYSQLTNDSCSSCSITPNNDTCRGVVNPCDTNAILKVKKDRVCAEWIACNKAELITDIDGNVNYNCFSIQGCEKNNEEGQCTDWIPKKTYQELDTTHDLTYYVHSGDADQLYDIQNYTGYVKVGLTWGDYTMCEGGYYDGQLCTTDNDCLDEGDCEAQFDMDDILSHTAVIGYQCNGGSNQGDACGTLDGGGAIQPNEEVCDEGTDDGVCSDVFVIPGYYPYGWMYEAGETGSDTGGDLIEYGNFEQLYCTGNKVSASIPCVVNSYDDGAARYGNCWQTSFDEYINNDTTEDGPGTDDNPAEGDPTLTSSIRDCSLSGSPCKTTPSSADYYCPNSPSFGTSIFPFGQKGVYTETGWSGYGIDADRVFVTQYENTEGADLARDINNVLEVKPSQSSAYGGEDIVATDGGVKYDLQGNIQQGGFYALSLKGRFVGNYQDVGTSAPSLISIGLQSYNIGRWQDNDGDGIGDIWLESDYNTDWFVNGEGSVDIVFVIDTSDSMSTEITNLKNSVSNLASGLLAEDINARFAIVTMDKEDDGTDSTYNSWANRCVNVQNFLVADLTEDVTEITSALDAVDTQFVRVDPFQTISDVMNNSLTSVFPTHTEHSYTALASPQISYRPNAQKYIILLTDTTDEFVATTETIGGIAGCGDNGVPDTNFYSNLNNSEYNVYVMTDYCINMGGECDGTACNTAEKCTANGSDWYYLPDYYNSLVTNGHGVLYSELGTADWGISGGMMESIQENIIANREYFQFNNLSLDTYTFGPIIIEERLPCADCTPAETDINGEITTDLIITSNDGSPFYIDDVSLLPILEVNKDIDSISRSCRAYSSNSDIACNYIESNGVQHKGWQGYCLETDPENSSRCITWWPLDIIAGESSLYTKTQGGYSDRTDVYQCLVAKGYQRVGFCYEDTDDAAGTARACQPSDNNGDGTPDYDDSDMPSDECGGSRCFMGAEYNIPQDGTGSYSTSYVQGGGTCYKVSDISDHIANDCGNYENGSSYLATSEDTDSGDTADPETIYISMADYADQARCIDAPNRDDYWGEDMRCHFDLDDDGVYEIASNIECTYTFDGSSPECNSHDYLDTYFSSYSSECQKTMCSGGSEGNDCDPENDCPAEAPINDFTGNYIAKTRKWHVPDPWDALEVGTWDPDSSTYVIDSESYSNGYIVRLPANVIEKNIHISEIQDIYYYMGQAGEGSGGSDETEIWGQDRFYGGQTEDAWIKLTDLENGAINSVEEKNYDRCFSVHVDDVHGFGCTWWGQYDSKGDKDQINRDVETNPDSLYDLVFVYAYSTFNHRGRVEGGDEGSGNSGDYCDMDSDTDNAYEHYGSLTTTMEDSNFLNSNCMTGLIRRIVRFNSTNLGDFSGYENNPWKVLSEDALADINQLDASGSEKALITEDDFDRTWRGDWPNMTADEGDSENTGGAILSVWLDFGADGYLENIYTMVWNGAEDVAEITLGTEVTGKYGMALQYHLREPCAVIVNSVSSSGDNTAWAMRASGNGAVTSFGGFAYSNDTTPWGSISNFDVPFGVQWDTINENDEANLYLPTTYGQQPIFIWSPGNESVQGGDPYSCVGQCGTTYCVGDRAVAGQADCTSNEACGDNAICVGTDVTGVSGLGFGAEYSTGDVQLQYAAGDAQDYLKHIFADIDEPPYITNYGDDPLYGIYSQDSSDNYWDTDDFENMRQCTDNERPQEETDIGADTEFCGVRPTIEDITIDGNKSGSTYSISSGQTVELSFTSVVNEEQTELRKVYIDWGDGTVTDQDWNAMPGSHVYTNAYSCVPELAAYMYDYEAGVGCQFKGTITITDNWGWCSGEENTGNCVIGAETRTDITQDMCEGKYGGSFTESTDNNRYLDDEQGTNVRSACHSYDNFPFTIFVEEDQCYNSNMLVKFVKKIQKYIKRISPKFFYLGLAVFSGSFLIPWKIMADDTLGPIGGFIVRCLLWVFYALFILTMGKIATIAMRVVIWTSTFSGFTTLAAVQEAWVTVRDFSNLFFIVILLFIAFGTILKIEAYSYKKLLPKMIVAAILINFSKLICSVLVDASQIVMLTFVNAYKDAASQGLYIAFGLGSLLELGSPGVLGSADNSDIIWTEMDFLVAAAAAGAMITVMAVLMITFVIVLCARIVFIWTLTILSPLAFATSVLPATQKYSQQWWSTFGRYVVVGPLLSFFIWLALFMVIKAGSNGVSYQIALNGTGGGGIGDYSSVPSDYKVTSTTSGSTSTSTSTPDVAGNALDPTVIVNFIIATMMLLIGLQFSQQMASEVGSLTGKFGNLPKQLASGYANAIKKYGWKGTKAVTKTLAGGANDRIFKGTGIDLNLARQWEYLKKRSQELSQKRVTEGRAKAIKRAENGGFGALFGGGLGAADTMFEHYLPVWGTQGLTGVGFSFEKGFTSSGKGLITSIGNQGKHAKAEGQLEDLEKEKRRLEDERDKKREELGINGKKPMLTEDERQSEVTSIDKQIVSITAAQAALRGSSDIIDTSVPKENEPENHERTYVESALQELKAGRQEEIDTASKEKRKADTDDLDKNIALLEQALDAKGKFNIGVELHEDLRQAATNRGLELQRRNQKLESLRGNTVTPEQKYQALKAIEDAHEAGLKEMIVDGEKVNYKDKKEKLTERSRRTAPLIDPERQAAQRTLLQEKLKHLDTDNEAELRALFRDAIEIKDGVQALAVLLQSSKVGHLNEMMNELGYDASGEGWKDMMQEVFIKGGKISQKPGRKTQGLGNLGMDDQLVLGTAADASRAAKGVNHWAFAEAVNSKHGRFSWYNEPERQERLFIEASKVDFRGLLRNGNRLAFGEHYIDQNGKTQWRAMSGMIQLLSRNIDKNLAQAIRGGHLTVNPNLQEHVAQYAQNGRIVQDAMPHENRYLFNQVFIGRREDKSGFARRKAEEALRRAMPTQKEKAAA